MEALQSLQAAFAGSLNDALAPAPAFLKAHRGNLERRFNVYRNNVFAGLSGVLESRFPVVRKIVGEEFFSGFARQFVADQPPRSPALVFYGATFASYIQSAEECRDVPYLADVARIEWELHRCYHAADETVLGAADLAEFDGPPGALRLKLAASSAIVSSDYPAHSIWRANAASGPSSPLALSLTSEATLITRRGLSCEAVLLPPGGGAFAEALASGHALAHAASAGCEAAPQFRLDQTLGLMLGHGAFTSFSANSTPGIQPT